MEKVHSKLDHLFSIYSTKKYSKGEIIYSPEDAVKNIYYIRKGFIRSFSIDENGHELTINIYKPFSFFPITAALGGLENFYFFQALSSVETNKAPTNEVINYIKSDNDVLFNLTKRLAIGLEGLALRAQFLIRHDARQKIASTLMLMVRRFGENKKGALIVGLRQTHLDIANIAGITRETASIELKKLEKEKIIKRKSKTTIVLNIFKLQEISIIYDKGKPLPHAF